MSLDALLIVAGLGGMATYLTRFLPMVAAERLKGGRLRPSGRRFLLALGPAAIAAMLALSLADLLAPVRSSGSMPAVLAGTALVFLIHRLTRNPAWATLAGAFAYAVTITLAAA